MDLQAIPLLPHHQITAERFIQACQVDERVIAASIIGSYAKGKADAYSDLDLCLITSDDTYEEFNSELETFIRLLGEPVFLENFGRTDTLFFIFPNDTEGELTITCESQFTRMDDEPYCVLLDKKGVLANPQFTGQEINQAEQSEMLRQSIVWFWHELSHFITAMSRNQLWWAQGQLEALRLMCVNLARVKHNLPAETEPYFKVDVYFPVEHLSTLRDTFGSLDEVAMLQAGLTIVQFYRELAPAVAQTHGIPYPDGLERVMLRRLERLTSL